MELHTFLHGGLIPLYAADISGQINFREMLLSKFELEMFTVNTQSDISDSTTKRSDIKELDASAFRTLSQNAFI